MGLPLDDKASAEVLRQVEFYFSDSNLPGDKFLRKCLEESEDGLVSLPLICSFQRMRGHLGLKESGGPDDVPADFTAAVAEILRKSSVLRISEDGQKVGRVNPLLKPEDIQAAVDARSVAVGPLRWNVTMEELQIFFSQHAKVNSVRLPRYPGGKAFSGSAVIELTSEEEAKKLLESKMVYDGIELEITTKKDFDAEMAKHPIHQKDNRNKSVYKHEPVEIFYPKGVVVAFSLQKKGAENAVDNANNDDSASAKKNIEEKNEIGSNAGVQNQENTVAEMENEEPSKENEEPSKEKNEEPSKENEVPSKENEEPSKEDEEPLKEQEESLKDEVPAKEDGIKEGTPAGEAHSMEESPSTGKGSSVEDTKEEDTVNHPSTTPSKEDKGEENKDMIRREDIKDVFKVYGVIKYVDFKQGDTSGFVRFEDPESVKKARMAAVLAEAGGIVVKDHIVTLEAVEGEAEKEYWVKVRSFQDKVRGDSGGRGSFHGRGRGSHDRPQRGGRNRFHGRGRHNENGRDKGNNNDRHTGKHERFNDNGGDEEPPSKQSKSDAAASAS